MLASQTGRSTEVASKVLWSLCSVSTDFLGLETRLGSLAQVILMLRVVGLKLRVLGHYLQPQQTSPHVQHLGWVERRCSPLLVVLSSLLELQD